MPRHHSALHPSKVRGARTAVSCHGRPTAENTAKAACSDGQAFLETSIVLRNASDGYWDKSIAGWGTVVGRTMNRPKPITAIAKDTAPQEANSSPSLASAGPRAT